MKLTNLYNTYDTVIAIAEKSAGNAEIGDMWLETKSFKKHTPISEIIKWASEINCSGKLIITIDESSIRKPSENEIINTDEKQDYIF
jgi:hypothetical protein